MKLLSVVLFAGLAGCGGGGAPRQESPVTIPNVAAYLAQNRCSDGSPPFACANPIPQQAGDPMFWRRKDWPAPGGQIEDSVVAAGHFVTTWSYAPFGPFVAANGDGGEVMVSDGGTVRIASTQDGGKPGITQFADWWLFDNRVPAGSWREHGQARARRESVTFPADGYGLSQIVSDTIISEHYNDFGYGGAMERFFMGAGWGRLLWEAWAPPGIKTPPVDLAQRCPGSSHSAPPDVRPDWQLYDCRLMTRLVPSDGTMSVTRFGWPP